jgi:hypothetical protein
MSPPASTANTGSSDNHFTRAFRWEDNVCHSRPTSYPTSLPPGHHVNRPRVRMARQLDSICRAQLHGSHRQLEQCQAFNQGASTFMATMLPTTQDLIEHTQQRHKGLSRRSATPPLKATALEISLATRAAWELVRREHKATERSGVYGRVALKKPDDAIRVMYENFSSLSLFATGTGWHKKIQQIDKLMGDYGVDILAGCETRTDWRFAASKDNKFHNLFGWGQRTWGVAAHFINDGKIKRDQWGGTCITTVGQLLSFVTETGMDSTGLRRCSWVRIGGGGGEITRVITA